MNALTNSAQTGAIGFLIATLAVAVLSDVRSQRIPNWLTFCAVIIGVCLATVTSGLSGLIWSLGGLLVGVALLMIFYVLGGSGAGDVKLMGAVGAFLGPWGVINAFLWTAIAGGVYAVGLIFFHMQFRPMRSALVTTLTNYLYSRKIVYNRPQVTGSRPRLCYGVAIALGTIVSIFVKVI